MEDLLELYQTMGISPAVYAYGEAALERLKERFDAIDRIAEYNQAKVLWAMRKNRVSAATSVTARCHVSSTVSALQSSLLLRVS